MRNWTGFLFYRHETLRTTWLLRCVVVVSVCLLIAVTRNYWVRIIARSLMCPQESGATAEAVIVENFDTDYPLFEEAARFQHRGTRRILIPVAASGDGTEPNLVSARIAELFANLARLRDAELIPVLESEPIVLNTAYRVRTFLDQQQIRSVALLSPAFRSRRSALVFKRVLGESGITVACVPVLRNTAPYSWVDTWHGIQVVTEQFIKLQYYRFYVLPFVAGMRAPVPSWINRSRSRSCVGPKDAQRSDFVLPIQPHPCLDVDSPRL